jgi:hypothetical protein
LVDFLVTEFFRELLADWASPLVVDAAETREPILVPPGTPLAQATRQQRVGALQLRLAPGGELASVLLENMPAGGAQVRALGLRLDSTFRQAALDGGFAGLASGVPRVIHLELLRGAPSRSLVALTRVPRQVIRVDTPVERIEGPMPMPPRPWPEGFENAVVRLRFIVGLDGRADSTTIEVVSASHEAFVADAIQVTAATEFRPAMAAGCPLASTVEQNIRYVHR